MIIRLLTCAPLRSPGGQVLKEALGGGKMRAVNRKSMGLGHLERLWAFWKGWKAAAKVKIPACGCRRPYTRPEGGKGPSELPFFHAFSAKES